MLLLFLNMSIQPVEPINLSTKWAVKCNVLSPTLPATETCFEHASLNHVVKADYRFPSGVSFISVAWRKDQIGCTIFHLLHLFFGVIMFNMETKRPVKSVHHIPICASAFANIPILSCTISDFHFSSSIFHPCSEIKLGTKCSLIYITYYIFPANS